MTRSNGIIGRTRSTSSSNNLKTKSQSSKDMQNSNKKKLIIKKKVSVLKVSDVIDLYGLVDNATLNYTITGFVTGIARFDSDDKEFDIIILFDDGSDSLTKIKISSKLVSIVLDIDPNDYCTFEKFMKKSEFKKYKNDLKNKLLSLKGTFSVRLFTSKPTTLEIFNHDKMLLEKTSANPQVNDFNNNDDLLKNFKQTESIDTSTSLSSKNSKDSNDSSKDLNDSFLQRVVEYETNTFDMKVTDNIDEVNTVMNLVNNSSSTIDSEFMICTLKYENTDNNYGYFVFTASLDKLVLLHPKN